jgi:integrase
VEIDLQYLNKIKAKGRAYWYYRRNVRNIALGLAPDAEGFTARYAAIHAQFEGTPSGEAPPAEGYLAALIDTYKLTSPEYRNLKPTSERAYDAYLDLLSGNYGKHRVRTMPRAFVFELRDKYQDTLRKANYIDQVLRAVLTFGVDRGWRADNPASKPKLLKSGSDGHRPFEETEISAFRDCWKNGALERACFELLINSGQRMSDIVNMIRSHVDTGEISVAQEKTGARLDSAVERFETRVRCLSDGARPSHSSGDAQGEEANRLDDLRSPACHARRLPRHQVTRRRDEPWRSLHRSNDPSRAQLRLRNHRLDHRTRDDADGEKVHREEAQGPDRKCPAEPRQSAKRAHLGNGVPNRC